MKYLSHIVLKGYKSIQYVQVSLCEGLNIIVGNNGSGKSNFMHYLHQSLLFSYPMRAGVHIELQFNTSGHVCSNWQVKGSIPKKSTWGRLLGIKNTTTIITETLTNNGEMVYHNSATVVREDSSNFVNHSVDVYTQTQIKNELVYIPAALPPSNSVLLHNSGRFIISPPTKVKHPKLAGNLKCIQQLIRLIVKQCIEQHGHLLKNTHQKNVLQLLSQHFNGRFVSDIKRYSPIQDIRFSPNIHCYAHGNELVINNLQLEFLVGDQWMLWQELSEGIQRLFQIMAEVSFNSQSICLIEHPELYLHPQQLQGLMQFLARYSQSQQIIVTTHSPIVIGKLLQSNLVNQLLETTYSAEKGTCIHTVHNVQAYMQAHFSWVYRFFDTMQPSSTLV